MNNKSFSLSVGLICLLFIFQSHLSFSQTEYGHKPAEENMTKELEQAREKIASEQEIEKAGMEKRQIIIIISLIGITSVIIILLWKIRTRSKKRNHPT